ncbi:flagellar biosynthesis protein FlhF [Amphibacillus marinus]|uniref:Flagellar biosynthesis protein FlhF n=1 Tax=Amphibacillus marinus TaxID=872970 RepID=A0A1H8HPZ0_9BACI|nr:flagellar biosynthesis protein FlhF [Amphibacillus marinus]SEN58169.1 flagellar biosynthesis protein FlhF [Amphibacillus marinus]
MRIKKFIAPTMPEVMDQVKQELGSEAVILNSKVIHKGGVLGLFKKRNIEVVAAIEPHPVQQRKQQSAHKHSNSSVTESSSNIAVLEELRSLRKMIQANPREGDDERPILIKEFLSFLMKQDIKQDIAEEITTHLYESNLGDETLFADLLADFKVYLLNHFQQKKCGSKTFATRFIHLVGPTGVGKTTTIAKLAAKSLLKDGKKVALITTDTYRIAAIEQLRTYAKILDIPLEIAYNIEDYQKARLKFQAYDTVFVDTAGRNFQDEKYINELGNVVDLDHDIETYLVMALTAKAADLDSIYKKFATVPIKGLILTKQDETASMGSVLNLTYANPISIAFITNGQDVPDDIVDPTPAYLTELLTKGNHSHV